MAVVNGTPMGYGHVFAPEHYLKAWLNVFVIGDLLLLAVVATGSTPAAAHANSKTRVGDRWFVFICVTGQVSIADAALPIGLPACLHGA